MQRNGLDEERRYLAFAISFTVVPVLDLLDRRLELVVPGGVGIAELAGMCFWSLSIQADSGSVSLIFSLVPDPIS